MILQLILLYLLHIVSMLLFDNILSIAQLFRLFRIPLETGRKLKVPKSYKRSF